MDPSEGSGPAAPLPTDSPPLGSDGDATRLAAHELRSQVTVLSGYLAMLEDGSLGVLPANASAALVPMRAMIRAMLRLVEDMLEDARFRDGRLHLSRSSVDVRTVTEAVLEESTVRLSDRHQFRVNLPAEPVVVNGDGSRIGTIIRNLIDNALKYSPDGGTVECWLEVDAGAAVIIVTDEGIGIDPADADRLFDRFERGSAGEYTSEGVGLGLYVSRTLARLHGGDLTVSGGSDGGSRFTLRIPLEVPTGPGLRD